MSITIWQPQLYPGFWIWKLRGHKIQNKQLMILVSHKISLPLSSPKWLSYVSGVLVTISSTFSASIFFSSTAAVASFVDIVLDLNDWFENSSSDGSSKSDSSSLSSSSSPKLFSLLSPPFELISRNELPIAKAICSCSESDDGSSSSRFRLARGGVDTWLFDVWAGVFSSGQSKSSKAPLSDASIIS